MKFKPGDRVRYNIIDYPGYSGRLVGFGRVAEQTRENALIRLTGTDHSDGDRRLARGLWAYPAELKPAASARVEDPPKSGRLMV